jgi:hypothetical protein
MERNGFKRGVISELASVWIGRFVILFTFAFSA